MDAGLLNCSMMPPMTTVVAVTDSIDIDLDRLLEKFIDKHRKSGEAAKARST